MRLNAKTAKGLRAEARYKNQTLTPSTPEFPGVARLYSAPVYETRPSFSSEYRRVNGVMERVMVKGTSMKVVGYKGREQIIPLEMEMKRYPLTIDVDKPDGTTAAVDHPRAGETYWEPKLAVVAVTKPVAATGEKAVYRKLKRLHRRGILAAAAMYNEEASA